jgi:hypothetical protein
VSFSFSSVIPQTKSATSTGGKTRGNCTEYDGLAFGAEDVELGCPSNWISASSTNNASPNSRMMTSRPMICLEFFAVRLSLPPGNITSPVKACCVQMLDALMKPDGRAMELLEILACQSSARPVCPRRPAAEEAECSGSIYCRACKDAVIR